MKILRFNNLDNTGLVYDPLAVNLDADEPVCALEDGRLVQVNPGTGPVANANRERATHNMLQFVLDCPAERIDFNPLPEADYGEGRFAFKVFKRGITLQTPAIVQMPGCPIEQVRYMGELGQNVFNFPRLYVNDLSWVWVHALLRDEDFAPGS